jgi:sulfide:quinone oxidoreductase
MQFKRINACRSVAEQIAPEIISGIAAAGFKSIIGNRPDDEGADLPGLAEIEASAKAAACQPVNSGEVKDSDARAFGAIFPIPDGRPR